MDKEIKFLKNVGVYSKPTTSSKKLGTIKKGTKNYITNKKTDAKGNTWYKLKSKETHWVMAHKKSSDTDLIKLTKNNGSKITGVDNDTSSSDIYKELKKQYTSNAANNGQALRRTMQLFGLPYQFLPSTDQRIGKVSKLVGRQFINKFITDAPVVYIMPGKPVYLPGQKDKASITQAFLQAANGNLGALQTLAGEQNIENLKMYDFRTAHIEYMRYVNVMCRTCAAFLELHDNTINYKINGVKADFMVYDWKDYNWNGENYSSQVARIGLAMGEAIVDGTKKVSKSVFNAFSTLGDLVSNVFNGKKSKKKVKYTNKKGKNASYTTGENELNINDNSALRSDEDIDRYETLLRNAHYIQFYCDASQTNVSESIGNQSKQSSLASAFNSFEDTVKDLAFMANTGGVNTDKLQELGESFIGSLGNVLSGGIGTFNASAGSLVSRLFSGASNVIKGENIIFPDIYSNSSYQKSYTIVIPCRAIYGNKFSLYMDCLVPMCHALCFALPKATSANTFAAPFLVKCFMPGRFVCNMGLVETLTLEHDEETRNVDGLSTAITITMTIVDLYSDLTMTPANDPLLFINNSSLIEYLAINCGLDLVDANTQVKYDYIINTIANAVNPVNVIENVAANVGQALDNVVNEFLGLP